MNQTGIASGFKWVVTLLRENAYKEISAKYERYTI